MDNAELNPQQLEQELAAQRRRNSELEDAHATLAQQNVYLRALHATTLDLFNRLEPGDLLVHILKRAAELVNTPHGYIYLVEPGENEIEVKVGLGAYTRFIGFRLRAGEGLAGRVWASGQPLVVDDYCQWPGRSPQIATNLIHATVGMPLVCDGRVAGVIGLGHTESSIMFGAGDMEVLSRFAELAAIALNRVRLLDETRRRAERMAALNTIGQALSATLSLQQLYRMLHQQASRVLKVDAFYIALYDETQKLIHFPFHYDEGEFLEPLTSPLGNGPTSHAIRSRAPFVINHPGDQIQEGGAFFGNLGRASASAMHVPMLTGNRLIGVISTQSYQEEAYNADDLQMFEIIASQAAISIENARLYDAARQDVQDRQQAQDELQQRNRELTLLNQVSQTIISTLDIDQVLTTVLNQVCHLLRIPSSSAWLFDSETGDLVCQHAVGIQSREVLGWRLKPGEGVTGWVASHGESVILADAQADRRHYGGVDEKSELVVRAMLSVPLRARDRVIGTLNVVDSTAGRFRDPDRRLLELLAAHAAIAIDNARLVDELRRYATELEARNEELDAFAHTVAHDLGNPIANITGYAETLEERCDDISVKDRQYALHAIARNGRKMNNIIQELLLLAGVRKTAAHIVPLDMANIISEAGLRLADLIEEYHAEITLPDPAGWPPALGHAPWLEEVWVNYLSNAIKYGGTPAAPPQIELGGTLQPNGMVRFWVYDHGDGLVPEAQARLFTPFTRLDQTRARGHGLGLSIVRRIIERMNGQVGVESTGVPGQGCTFYFTLPAARRI